MGRSAFGQRAARPATTEDVDDLIKAAVAAGARLLGPALKTPWGAYSGYFADPDGHAWEAAYTPDPGLPRPAG
jgi:uncharacterized glyoxalase superfamily protein PhnB